MERRTTAIIFRTVKRAFSKIFLSILSFLLCLDIVGLILSSFQDFWCVEIWEFEKVFIKWILGDEGMIRMVREPVEKPKRIVTAGVIA